MQGTVSITVNGEAFEVPSGLTVRELFAHLTLGAGPFAVEINREIVPRAEHATHVVAAGDVLEIVHFVGGG